jgi:hypothetical protein
MAPDKPTDEYIPAAPETLTHDMAADLMAVADARVAADCQTFLAGRRDKAKPGLIHEGTYNGQFAAQAASGKGSRKAPPSKAWIHSEQQHDLSQPDIPWQAPAKGRGSGR